VGSEHPSPLHASQLFRAPHTRPCQPEARLGWSCPRHPHLLVCPASSLSGRAPPWMATGRPLQGPKSSGEASIKRQGVSAAPGKRNGRVRRRGGAAAARPCALPPPRAPASPALGLQTCNEPAPIPVRCPYMPPLCRRSYSSRSSLDGCLLQAAASAAGAAAPGRAMSAGSASASSLLHGRSIGGNVFDVAELLGQISLLAPAPTRPASAGSGGPRAITDGSNRVAWIQPSGEL
jgi:hypothetical protein